MKARKLFVLLVLALSTSLSNGPILAGTQSKESPPASATRVDPRFKPYSFGYKMGWLAIRTSDTQAVVRALHLTDTKASGWQDGVNAAYGESISSPQLLFVSAPVRGWTFVVGRWTMGPSSGTQKESFKKLEKMVADLSKSLGEVQSYATHRVVEYHHWIDAKNGQIIRAFGYIGESGETLDQLGKPTTGENFNWKGFAQFDWLPDEDSVMTVAGHWSVNPQTLDKEPPSKTLGVLGKAPAWK